MRAYCKIYTQRSVVILNGKEIQKRGNTFKHIADLLCYTIEINTTVLQQKLIKKMKSSRFTVSLW